MSRRTATPAARLAGGFTLVEVLVSLVLAGMIALVAHGIFATAIHGASEVRAARASLDHRHEAHRLLGAMLLSVDVGTVHETPFYGSGDKISFSAWLQTPDGWFERTRIEISADGQQLIAIVPRRDPIVLYDSIAAVEFGYLLQHGADSRWIREWVSEVSAPLGVRMRVVREHDHGRVVSDTMVYLIKARG
jgi:prepilin-type N-terminal cleavage/methylation domain-containing protein